MEHLVNDLLHCRLQAWTFPAGIEARWLGEGILQLLPTAPWRQATILSAGVHGNETAPIELLLTSSVWVTLSASAPPRVAERATCST